MKLKSVVLAAALAVAGAAHASTPIFLDLSSGEVTFASTAASQEYTFTLLSDVIGGGAVSASLVKIGGKTAGYDITSVVFNGVTLVPDATGPTYDNFTLFDGLLTAGTYSFTINGVSKAGGVYTGAIAVTPAVPEAGSMAMALAGLGMVGLVAARRRRV